MRLASALLLASCGPASHTSSPRPSPDTSPAIVERFPRPTFDVVPAELGDRGVLDRIRARAVVQVWCVLSIGDELIGSDTEHCRETNTYDVAAVIDYNDSEVRVVIEADNARYAAGIVAPLVMWTVLGPTTIGNVSMTPGVALHESETNENLFSFLDPHLSVEQVRLPAERRGRIFVARDSDPPPVLGVRTGKPWSAPRDRPHVTVSDYAVIRARPAGDAPEVARTDAAEHTIATKLGVADGWTEIELHRPNIRVRGFVENSDIGEEELVEAIAHDVPPNYPSASHAVRHRLPAGTCLYDRVDGRVIGVTLETRERPDESAINGWAKVTVGTPWSRATMAIRDLGTAPTRWENCVEPSRR